MGVFAYSVHIQCDEISPTIGALRTVMDEFGFRENLDTPQDSWEGVDVNRLYEQAIRGTKQSHAFYFTEARDGWVSLLSRNQWDIDLVLAALSYALDTQVLACYVHDSDFYREGACSDDFNSDRARLTQDDVLRMLSIGEGEEVVGYFPQLSKAATKLESLLSQRRPPELRKFDQYMDSVHGAICDGFLSDEDLDRYAAWGVTEAKSIMAAFPGEFPDSLWKLEKDPGERFAAVRSVLRPGFAESDFTVCLEKIDLAERCLELFLGMCEIPSHFAHLNYESVGRRGEETLANDGVVIARHLEFKQN